MINLGPVKEKGTEADWETSLLVTKHSCNKLLFMQKKEGLNDRDVKVAAKTTVDEETLIGDEGDRALLNSLTELEREAELGRRYEALKAKEDLELALHTTVTSGWTRSNFPKDAENYKESEGGDDANISKDEEFVDEEIEIVQAEDEDTFPHDDDSDAAFVCEDDWNTNFTPEEDLFGCDTPTIHPGIRFLTASLVKENKCCCEYIEEIHACSRDFMNFCLVIPSFT